MKVIKWLFISVFGLAGLLVTALTAFFVVVDRSASGIGSDGGAGWALTRSLFHDGPRYFELTASLEVEGEPLEITRVIECRPYFRHQIPNYFQKRWYPVNEAMTHRLPDGSGVIVVAPALCNDSVYPQPEDAPSWRAFPALPDDFVPLIFWTPDANNPELLEGYLSFESLERADARVRFKSIVLRNDPTLKPSKSQYEFGVLANTTNDDLFSGDRPKKSVDYIGFYLTSVGKDQWQKASELRTLLEGRNESGFLERMTQFRARTDLDQRAIRGSMGVRRRSEHSEDFSTPIGRKFWVLDNLLGFREDSGVYRPADGEKGVIFYTPRKINDNNIGFAPLDGLRLSVGGKEFFLGSKFSVREYYSAKTQEIYQIDYSTLRFLPNEGKTERGESDR